MSNFYISELKCLGGKIEPLMRIPIESVWPMRTERLLCLVSQEGRLVPKESFITGFPYLLTMESGSEESWIFLRWDESRRKALFIRSVIETELFI